MSLNIDFAPPKQKQSPLSLGIGSTMLLLTLALAWALTSETEAGLPPNQTLMPGEEEIQSINRAVDDLNFPWLAVLTSLENSTDERLRIIQIDADARDGRLSLQGEARDSRAVLVLPGHLRSHAAISDARVVSQSPADTREPREFPVRFALEITLSSSAEAKP